MCLYIINAIASCKCLVTLKMLIIAVLLMELTKVRLINLKQNGTKKLDQKNGT